MTNAPTYLPEYIMFGLIASSMVVAAVRVVTTKNVVHAALWLVLVLGGVAGLFILLASEFTAITQVLVYIGAIVVLFLFGIMLTRAPLGKSADLDNNVAQRIVGALVGLSLLGVMVYGLVNRWSDQKIELVGSSTRQLGQTTEQISDSIFSTYLVPFEVVSVLLLAALIGAIVLARRD
ncbi:MAG: NADH-quinone oxidoreductase subunit J [Actinobacteria bacterium]|nr:NADH-quinone oxidoreductase subunit J [Actinomycetota bacterium]